MSLLNDYNIDLERIIRSLEARQRAGLPVDTTYLRREAEYAKRLLEKLISIERTNHPNDKNGYN